MLQSVSLQRFRGLTRDFDLVLPETGSAAPRVRVVGKNGARKTTLREAIAFLFTGRDSTGSAKPTHLIEIGYNDCAVSGVTRRGSVISRTLTQKGNGTLTLNGNPMSQTEFEAVLCPSDVFLSVFIPGFVLGSLPKNRQSAVLSFILPPVDRIEYMKSAIDHMPLIPLDYSKRPDLLQKQLADKRNELTHKIAEKRGESKSLKEKLERGPVEPEQPPELALFDLQETVQRQWLVYESALSQYEAAIQEIQRKSAANQKIAKQRAEAEAELSSLKLTPYPEPPPEFKEERPVQPPLPPLQNEELRDRCPSCGQAVGLKHREMVRAQNDEIRAAFMQVHEVYIAALEKWAKAALESDAARTAHGEKVSAVGDANDKVRRRRYELEDGLQKLVLLKLPAEEPQPPKKPEEEFSKVRYLELKKVVEDYYRRRGAYDSWKATGDTALTRLDVLEVEIGIAEGEVELHRAHEEALRLLPGYELLQQKAHLTLPAGYELSVEEGFELRDSSGCPYEILSRGQRMHADFQMCLKVNALLQRKVGMVFLDDFDLADWGPLLAEESETVQIFVAHVEGEKELNVSLSK